MEQGHSNLCDPLILREILPELTQCRLRLRHAQPRLSAPDVLCSARVENHIVEESVQYAGPHEAVRTAEIPEAEAAGAGLARAMDPRPDHGEESYRGLGRLVGRKALITGEDSGIGRAAAIAFAARVPMWRSPWLEFFSRS